MQFQFNDGGRAKAGFKGETRDCVTRAIAIATGTPYEEVYTALDAIARYKRKPSHPRTGVHREVYQQYLHRLGWAFTPTMSIGSGCKVHLKADELPPGPIIAMVSRHLCAVVDGVIHDTFDPSRGGTRCVYGYYRKVA